MPHPERAHYETTEEFSAIHDEHAYLKLNGEEFDFGLNYKC